MSTSRHTPPVARRSVFTFTHTADNLNKLMELLRSWHMYVYMSCVVPVTNAYDYIYLFVYSLPVSMEEQSRCLPKFLHAHAIIQV